MPSGSPASIYPTASVGTVVFHPFHPGWLRQAVREGKWKLVALHRGPWELYDLEADRTETNNLAGRYPERARKMAALWAAWAKRSNVAPWDEMNRVPEWLPVTQKDGHRYTPKSKHSPPPDTSQPKTDR